MEEEPAIIGAVIAMEKRLSIVIIGRNEASSIRRCATAVMAAADQIGGAEMIYVDSNSTDETVAIMDSLGFKTVTVYPGLRMTPSAGRFVGSRLAKGDYVLFLDADTLIYRDFLPIALDALDDDPSIGGVGGPIDDFTESGESVKGVEEPCEGEAEVKWLRGPCCLYRREALMQAGSFDPNLAMEEEAELGLRLTKLGWRLKKIPIAMAMHTRCYHGDSLASVINTFIRDGRARRLGEITKTISHAFIAGNGFAFCWLRLKTSILFAGWLILIGAAVMLPAFLHPWKIAGLIALSGFFLLYLKKRSIYQAVIFIPSKTLNLVDILMGIHKIEITRSRIKSLRPMKFI
jgi:cellulose synthase/poly-beta-1,6-N-acetylglucosamine synthase-like glycosyltransferase